jgi:pimeloyl-ACP methyl ester carboxylesterase
VGHSMGGLVAPLAADAHNVRGLVLLCAVVPEPGRSFVDQNADASRTGPSTVSRDALAVDDRGLTRFRTRAAVGETPYQDCADAIAD